MPGEGSEYVVISQPRLHTVVYAKVNMYQYDPGNDTFPLVTAGLKNPMGLAVDNNRGRLFVADSEAGKVFMYNLKYQDGYLNTDGKQHVAASGGLEPRWVSVSENGDLFVTDEASNLIVKVAAAQLKALEATPTEVFSGSGVKSVSSPGGISVDNQDIFWVNKMDGQDKGTVVKGLDHTLGKKKKGQTSAPTVLASQKVKAFGCCTAANNIFYTVEEKYVYAIKKSGGSAVPVVDSLISPRGCAWDGANTVYIADRGGNALMFFPSGMHSLKLADVHTMIMVEDPFGVAVALKPPPAPIEESPALPFVTQIEGFLGMGAPQ